MTNLIDRIHFQELSELDPIDVCRRALCKYDDAEKFYAVSVWGAEYRVFPHTRKIKCIYGNDHNLHDYFHLFVIHYLLKTKEIDILKEWISEKDIPGGTTFFRGPHQIPSTLITARFKNNIDRFKKACERLNGVQLKMADGAFVFDITSRIPVAVLYWVGDDDFRAESKILYDRTITEHLASDIVYALAVGICQRLAIPLDKRTI